jgi:hypothetical protein
MTRGIFTDAGSGMICTCAAAEKPNNKRPKKKNFMTIVFK